MTGGGPGCRRGLAPVSLLTQRWNPLESSHAAYPCPAPDVEPSSVWLAVCRGVRCCRVAFALTSLRALACPVVDRQSAVCRCCDFAPRLLQPLNRAWQVIGWRMGQVVSPLVLGLIFFLLITPMAVVMRIMGRDVLRLKKRAQASYWLERTPAGPQPDSFKNQF